MSPLSRIEVNIFIEITASLRRWADALEAHAASVGDEAIGPAWSEADIIELYETWVRVGHALRDVARTQPDAFAAEPRRDVLAIRDGMVRIADIVGRQG